MKCGNCIAVVCRAARPPSSGLTRLDHVLEAVGAQSHTFIWTRGASVQLQFNSTPSITRWKVLYCKWHQPLLCHSYQLVALKWHDTCFINGFVIGIHELVFCYDLASPSEDMCATFKPTADIPALQYIGSVDAGSVAEKAGLKKGDFLLSVSVHVM